jgi:nucleoid-associated protein YgaU
MEENDNILRPMQDGNDSTIISEYTIEERDTISDIENKFGLSWQEILDVNKDVIKEPNTLIPGLRIKVPNKK